MDKQKQIFYLHQRTFDYILQKPLLHQMEAGLYPNRASIYIKRKLCLYETRGCVKTLAQPLLYFTVLLYFLLAMLLFPHAFGNKLLYSNYIGL